MNRRELGVIQTVDPRMKSILEMTDNVAASRATVLIFGESGCGKELLARYIHARSPRASQKLVAINCAAMPEGLLESELFGYEKGAFTGADQRKIGKFEMAHDSSFLLDEISELPLLLQAKLLRALQEGEIERLGGSHPIKVNVRLIATSNRNLREMINQGRFREDLFYRLNVVPIDLPPLRERPRDIDLLARLFVEISSNENGLTPRRLDSSALEKLLSWHWPGNVRELQNVIERSVLLTKVEDISATEILIENYAPQEIEPRLKAGMTVSEAERWLILKTLESTGQNRTRAAELLGISIRTLRNKINEYKDVGGPRP
jgi:transcriptional regulator with PAS, ATPase and Fis domain